MIFVCVNIFFTSRMNTAYISTSLSIFYWSQNFFVAKNNYAYIPDERKSDEILDKKGCVKNLKDDVLYFWS